MPDALKVVLALLPAVGLFFVIRTVVGRRIAQAVVAAGADALCVINTMPGMVIDAESGQALLANRSRRRAQDCGRRSPATTRR